jgi:hypothetical protein
MNTPMRSAPCLESFRLFQPVFLAIALERGHFTLQRIQGVGQGGERLAVWNSLRFGKFLHLVGKFLLLGGEPANRFVQFADHLVDGSGLPVCRLPERGLGHGQFPAQSLDEHARLGEFTLALNQVALRGLFGFTTLGQLSFEMLDLFLELGHAFLEARLLASWSDGSGLDAGSVGDQPQKVLACQQTLEAAVRILRFSTGQQKQVQSQVSLGEQERLVSQASGLLLIGLSRPIARGDTGFLDQRTVNRSPRCIFLDRLFGEVGENAFAALGARAASRIFEPTRVGQADESVAIEQVVEDSRQAVGAQAVEELLLGATHHSTPRPGRTRIGSESCASPGRSFQGRSRQAQPSSRNCNLLHKSNLQGGSKARASGYYSIGPGADRPRGGVDDPRNRNRPCRNGKDL